jgi:hypothetical protein
VDVLGITMLSWISSLLLALPAVTCNEAQQFHAWFSQANYNTGDIIQRDVAIIGGGAGGTYAAINLKDLEKSIVLVERLSRLGGHVNTYQDAATGIFVDYGVQAYENITGAQAFFDRFDVPVVPYVPSSAHTVYVDFTSGQTLANFVPGDELHPVYSAASEVSGTGIGVESPNPCSRRPPSSV